MDADTLIYVLAFIFFVLPSILRRLGKKARPEKGRAGGLTGKLGGKLRDVFRELERQVQEARKEAGQREGQGSGPAEREGQSYAPSGGSIWDLLDDRDQAGTDVRVSTAEPPSSDALSQKPSADPAPGFYDPDHPFAVPKKSDRADKAPAPPSTLSKSTRKRSLGAALPPHALQQAVVWAEILGPPKGLQD